MHEFLIGTETFTLAYLLQSPLSASHKAWLQQARPGDAMADVTCIGSSLARAIDAVRAAHPQITPEEIMHEGAELLADDVLCFGALYPLELETMQ